MKQSTKQTLDTYNHLYNESTDVYNQLAKTVGVNTTIFWLFYEVYTNEEPLTQQDICNHLFMPKQTLNTALKKYEQEGYLFLNTDSKRKTIHLKEKGKQFVQDKILPIYEAELLALDTFTSEEQQQLIHLFKKYVQSLRKQQEVLK